MTDVTDASGMFEGCTALGQIKLPDMDSLTDTRSMFKGCSGIRCLDLSTLDLSTISHAGEMFASSGLETIYVNGNSFVHFGIQSGSGMVDGTDMFKGCLSLKGCNGTAYSSSSTGITYARIDKS